KSPYSDKLGGNSRIAFERIGPDCGSLEAKNACLLLCSALQLAPARTAVDENGGSHRRSPSLSFKPKFATQAASALPGLFSGALSIRIIIGYRGLHSGFMPKCW